MTKVIGSKVTFLEADDETAMEFLRNVADITAEPDYQKLKDFIHHNSTNRYQHCLNVAWYTFLWCRNAGLNAKSAARGAMLHDFYLYENKVFYQTGMRHAVVHPRYALINAKLHFEVDAVMEDCILYHMWPSGAGKPKTPEGVIICLADKYCASLEWGTKQYEKWSALEKEFRKSLSDN